ncbi:hypothetical protein CJ030_MR7G000044 [Morella rubra]|uniref:Putative plant transposon protein domain-containing protein n=1 Tax=Morella rubra TaxID=262757 RepID=A0A6A1V5I0_9ROSI|nr:hypothetical protein CJ030_MR7G000044 [Morella rubra]
MAPRRRASLSSQATQPRESLSLDQHQVLIYKRPVVIESTGDVYVDLVRDFYAQVLTVDADVEELAIQVRGVFFTLSANIIAQFIGLLRPQVPAYPTIGPPFDMTLEEVWKEVTGVDMTVPSTLICHQDMAAFFQVLHLIIIWDVAPKHHRSELNFKRGFLLVMVARRTPIDLPALIVQQILRDARTFSRSATHLGQAGAHVAGDVSADEDTMDVGPPPRSQPTQRGRSSTYEVGQSSSSQVDHPPWMNMLLDEIMTWMDKQFDKIEEEICELWKKRDT